VWDFHTPPDPLVYLRRVVRRETIRLVVLTAVAVAVFLATRVLAERAERIERQDAIAWYERGLQLAASDPDQAAVAFRRAVGKHRGEKRYVLALAETLSRANHHEPAQRALQQLREFNPEDVDVNLALGRLARAQRDTTSAVRYFHHAIYAPNSDAATARDIRLELVRMLLGEGETTQANSELLAATIDLPDDPALRVELASLFERAGNSDRAAEQYQRVLVKQPDHHVAMEGAIRTAFALGDYREVVRYGLPATASAETRALSTTARAVISRDPLGSRLSAAERRRRLLQNISYLEQRWGECGPQPPPKPPDYPQTLTALRTAARRAAIGRDTEALEAAVTSTDRLRSQIESRCGETTPIDRALAIIARLHGVNAA
jgi:Tfp pilus assembly protein PilF